MFLGTASHQILAWEPPQPELVSNIQLSDHTGWVRALAQHSHWLYRCDQSREPAGFAKSQDGWTGAHYNRQTLRHCLGRLHVTALVVRAFKAH